MVHIKKTNKQNPKPKSILVKMNLGKTIMHTKLREGDFDPQNEAFT